MPCPMPTMTCSPTARPQGTDDLSGGLVLRKTKAPVKAASKKSSAPKIKF